MFDLFSAVFTQFNHWYFSAAGAASSQTITCSSGGFLGFPHWWEYVGLQSDGVGGCVPHVDFSNLDTLWAILLAIIDMLLHAAGIVAVIMIIYAGFMYVTSTGAPDKAAAALKKIINTFVGLAIIILATLVVGFLGRSLLKT